MFGTADSSGSIIVEKLPIGTGATVGGDQQKSSGLDPGQSRERDKKPFQELEPFVTAW